MIFFENNLFASEYFEKILGQKYNALKKESDEIYQQLKELIGSIKESDKQTLKYNEGETERRIIHKVIKVLGYTDEHFSTKQTFSVSGKQYQLDGLLFREKKLQGQFNQNDKDQNDFVILENKAMGVRLDTQKTDFQHNAHYQILNYANTLRINRCITSNGRMWRFYDFSDLDHKKRYYEVDLFSLLEKGKEEDFFLYFYGIFSKTLLFQDYSNLKDEDQNLKASIKKQITDVLYGKDKDHPYSVVEDIGKILFQHYPQESLGTLFKNTFILMFRILFMANYQTRYSKVLEKHHSFDLYSIYAFYEKLKENQKHFAYQGYALLLEIFDYLDQGNTTHNIPMLNGSLFRKNETLLLETPNLMSNTELFNLLDRMLMNEGKKIDFISISTQDLGDIYELSLCYEFRINHKKELYLALTSNQRKQTGSYYTPTVFADFMIQNGISTLLQTQSPFEIKILDNACGSGQFLLRALKILSYDILSFLHRNDLSETETKQKTEIQKQLAIEREQITENIQIVIPNSIDQNTVIETETIDEKLIRRIVLKKCLFGVDMQPLALEICMIGLWMETFIFATPLSFIEHHFKVGNSLLYRNFSTISLLLKDKENKLFSHKDFEKFLEDCRNTLKKISKLKDLNSQEIKESTEIYYGEAIPKIIEMKAIFDFFFIRSYIDTMFKFDPNRWITKVKNKKDNKSNKYAEELKYFHQKYETFQKLHNFLIQPKCDENNQQQKYYTKENIQEIEKSILTSEWINKRNSYTDIPWFNPFHLEIEFPETQSKFDLIVGNPPWEKVQFNEEEFFNSWDQTYRSRSHSDKQIIRERYMGGSEDHYPDVKAQYHKETEIYKYNLYLQKHYPLSKGGQGNLFRYFIERNLSLIKPETGQIAYLTPAAFWMEKASTTLRKHILSRFSLEYLYSFENRRKFFKAVDSRYKFAIWKINTQQPDDHTVIHSQFLQTDSHFIEIDKKNKNQQADLDKKRDEGDLKLNLSFIKKINPTDWRFLEFKNETEIPLLDKIFALHSPMNKDILDFENELNMTLQKNMMINIDPPSFENVPKNHLIVYQGNMIHQFHCQFAPPEYSVDRKAYETRYQDRKDGRNLAIYPCDTLRLAWRQVAANTNERTVLSTLIPKNTTYTNAIWASQVCKTHTLEKLLYYCAIMNSLIFDWIARLFVEMNVTKNIMMRLPIPQPSEANLIKEPYRTLIENTIKLHLLMTPNHQFHLFDEFFEPEFCKKMAINRQKLIDFDQKITQNFDTFTQIRADNDRIVADLYTVSKKEFLEILSTFPLLKQKQHTFFTILEQLDINRPNHEST